MSCHLTMREQKYTAKTTSDSYLVTTTVMIAVTTTEKTTMKTKATSAMTSVLVINKTTAVTAMQDHTPFLASQPPK